MLPKNWVWSFFNSLLKSISASTKRDPTEYILSKLLTYISLDILSVTFFFGGALWVFSNRYKNRFHPLVIFCSFRQKNEFTSSDFPSQTLDFIGVCWQFYSTCVSSEPQPVADLLCEDPRPSVLHGGSVGRSHEDLDGRDCHRSRRIHTVHELMDTCVCVWQGQTGPPSCFPLTMDTFPTPFFLLKLTLTFFYSAGTHLHIFYVVQFGFKKGVFEGHAHTHTHSYTC